jgi:hypothetical protein
MLAEPRGLAAALSGPKTRQYSLLYKVQLHMEKYILVCLKGS